MTSLNVSERMNELSGGVILPFNATREGDVGPYRKSRLKQTRARAGARGAAWERGDEYDRYVRSEWDRFVRDAGRARASLEAVAGVAVARVLDVGCGAGQELLPFVTEHATLAVGVDIAPTVGRSGSALFAARGERAPAFVRGAAETLPFTDGAFDVVICRLAFPYLDNARAVAEITRVLRPGGRLLLKIHHARHYLHKLRDAARFA